REMTFDIRAGEALGIVGPDGPARRALMWMIAGYIPPNRGRVVLRGHVAPLFGAGELNITRKSGEASIKLLSSYFKWPYEDLKARWDEVLEFAAIDEIEKWPEGSMEYEAHRTKRLLLSTALHLDASIYLISG